MDLNGESDDLRTSFWCNFWSHLLLNISFGTFSIVVMHKLVFWTIEKMNDYLIHHTQVVVLGIAEPIPQPGPWIACSILVARELALKRY